MNRQISFLLSALATLIVVSIVPARAEAPAAADATARKTLADSGDRIGQAASAKTRKLRDMMGLGVKFSQGQSMKELPTLVDLGVRWVREDISWKVVEAAPGVYRFPADFKERLAFYRQNGIGVVYLLAYSNPVAYPATPDQPRRAYDPVAFGRYAAAAARMLRESGVSFVLEVWNEPHNTMRPVFGGEWNAKPPSPWVDHYVKLVAETVKQAKSVDPRIRILTDDDMWIIHYWFLEAGLPRNLDGFAVHPYAPRGPEKAAVDSNTDWCLPFHVVDDQSSFASGVQYLRNQGRTKLGRSPEIWVTEWGWKIGEKTPRGPVTEEMLAALLPRAFITAASAGVEAMLWFSAQDTVDGEMGLSDNTGRRRMSYFAFRALSQQLGDYVLVRQMAGAANPTSGVQAFLFRNNRDYKLVIWNLDTEQREVVLSGPFQNARANDALGQPVPMSRDGRSPPKLVLGPSPVYVSGLRDVKQVTKSLARQGLAVTN